MSVHYEVVPNKLTKPQTYSARTRPAQTVRLDALSREISAETTLSPSDIQAVVSNLIRRVQAELARGNNVTIDGLVSFGTSLTARFERMTDPLPADAKLNITTRAHPALVEGARLVARLERVNPTEPVPVLMALMARFGHTDGIAEGDIMELQGDRLRFHADAEDEGAFLIDSDTGREFRVEAYLDQEEKRILYLVPPITGKTVRFELRARRPNSKTLRVAAWPRLLPTRHPTPI